MLLLRKDNNYNYPKFKSVSFYSNRLAAHSVIEKSCTVIHLICTVWLPQRDSYICLCKWVICLIITFMGKFLVCISNLSIYSYKWSQYLFLQRNIHLCRFFVLHFPGMLYSFWCTAIPFFFFSVLVSALHNSLGLATTFLECSRNFLFVCCFF